MKFWQDPKFKSLEKQWYDKLKEDGFVDAEKTIGEDQVLIQNAPNAYRQAPQVIRENKFEYYASLTKCLQNREIGNWIDRLIMVRRSEGQTIKNIGYELETLGVKIHRQSLRFIIRKYENKWKIRKWKKSQLAPVWKHWGRAPTK